MARSRSETLRWTWPMWAPAGMGSCDMTNVPPKFAANLCSRPNTAAFAPGRGRIARLGRLTAQGRRRRDRPLVAPPLQRAGDFLFLPFPWNLTASVTVVTVYDRVPPAAGYEVTVHRKSRHE